MKKVNRQRKKKQESQGLVFQHLEKMSRTLLEKYPEVVREFAKSQNGIYALYKGNKLYYVGLAKNLRTRLRSHLRDRHRSTWDRFSIFLTTSGKHLKELESLVLRIASPKGNRTAGKFIQSRNLLPTIRKKIREIQRKERMDIIGADIPLKMEQVKSKGKTNLGGLASFISRRIHIRFRYKGKLYIAHIRKDGLITFDSKSAGSKALKEKKYKSPSGAASAIAGHAMSGWRCWTYKHSAGNWVALDNLRKKTDIKKADKIEYTEKFHMDGVNEEVKETYYKIKSRLLQINNKLIFNPQKYYISIVYERNIAFFRFRKKKIRLVVMLPEKEVKEGIKNHKIHHLSEGIQKYYNGPCCDIEISNTKDTAEVINLLKVLVLSHGKA